MAMLQTSSPSGGQYQPRQGLELAILCSSYWLSNAKELEQKQSLPRLELRFVILLTPVKEKQQLFTAVSLDNQFFLTQLIFEYKLLLGLSKVQNFIRNFFPGTRQ